MTSNNNSTEKNVEDFVFGLIRGDKMMPILYYLPPSPPCRAVLLMGRLVNIDFELKPIDVLAGDQMKPEFIQLNPQHTIPTLDDAGLVLWESRAILTYLASCYANSDDLYPKDFRVRALVDQRLQFDLGTLYSRLGDYYFPTIFMGAPLDESKKARLQEALRWFETILKGRDWCAAETFTVADLSLCITVSQIEAFGFELTPYPRVRAWLQKCKDELAPYGYEEINQTAADFLAGLFRSKLK